MEGVTSCPLCHIADVRKTPDTPTCHSHFMLSLSVSMATTISFYHYFFLLIIFIYSFIDLLEGGRE